VGLTASAKVFGWFTDFTAPCLCVIITVFCFSLETNESVLLLVEVALYLLIFSTN
jgi:hypothetical protein